MTTWYTNFGFSHGFSLTRFTIWKPYSHCHSTDKIHIWPLRLAVTFKAFGVMALRRIYILQITSRLYNLEILVFSMNLKDSLLRPLVTPTVHWWCTLNRKRHGEHRKHSKESLVYISPADSIWDRKCVWLRALRLGPCWNVACWSPKVTVDPSVPCPAFNPSVSF